ncbi:hypothetical protein ACWCSH_48515, partial [Streptosporangium sp. NPDC001682]
MGTGDGDAVVDAARAGDEPAFAALVERHRGELRVHCYRMLGSFDEGVQAFRHAVGPDPQPRTACQRHLQRQRHSHGP